MGVQAPFRIQGECMGLKPLGGFLTHISGPSFHFRKEMEVVPPALPEMCFQNTLLLRELTNTPDGMETKESKTQDKNPEEMADGKFSALFKYNLNILEKRRLHCVVITARGHTQC